MQVLPPGPEGVQSQGQPPWRARLMSSWLRHRGLWICVASGLRCAHCLLPHWCPNIFPSAITHVFLQQFLTVALHKSLHSLPICHTSINPNMDTFLTGCAHVPFDMLMSFGEWVFWVLRVGACEMTKGRVVMYCSHGGQCSTEITSMG